jgi:preprotein translocase subunit SecG
MENYSYLLGFIPVTLFLVMIVFSFIGVIMALLIHSTKRDQTSKNTPEKFSWKFILKDNWKTILLTILAILVTLRFAGSLFPTQFTNSDLTSPIGIEKWLFGSFGVGLGYNTLLQYLKDKTDFLKVKRS